jgi:TPR repeat protein
MKKPLLFIGLSLLLAACAHSNPSNRSPERIAPTPSPQFAALFGEQPPPISIEQIRQAESIRAEALKALYSKDPQVQNPALAFEKFQEAAALGDPISMDHLGAMHSTGAGGAEKNCAKAIEWFEKSAQLGYQIAMNNLAYTLVSCENKQLRDPAKAEDLMHYLFETNSLLIAWLDTYAAIQAEQGNFPKAANTMEVVVDLSELIGNNPERIDLMKKALSQYKKKKKLDAGQNL